MENTIYVGIYGRNTYKKAIPKIIPLPNSEWMVLPEYTGIDDKGNIRVDNRITLILEDTREKTADARKTFWPVISKMSDAEAQKLRDMLDQVLKQRKRETP